MYQIGKRTDTSALRIDGQTLWSRVQSGVEQNLIKKKESSNVFEDNTEDEEEAAAATGCDGVNQDLYSKQEAL